MGIRSGEAEEPAAGGKGDGAGRIALALSGGGFRATLFHLGVVRYLRDCGRLSSVSHVSGVSGGAVIAAHLVQRWEDYGSREDSRFQAAADELIRLTQSNVRGRILLGIPVRAVLNSLTWLVRTLVQVLENIPLFGPALPSQRILHALRPRSTSDSLEFYLKRFFKKPSDLRRLTNGTEACPAPDLYIHATNLTKGGASAFHAKSQRGTLREVFYHSEAQEGTTTIECDHMPIGRAVAYSASFPGVFPPRLLQPEGLGLRSADLQLSHLLTDGGVYDNLGLRRVTPEGGTQDFDQLIVSDAGAPLIADEGAHLRGGRLFLWQFKRAVSILLGRVGQLEKDLRNHPVEDSALIGAAETHFVELTKTYEPCAQGDLDRMAQRLLALLRTDLDAFSDLEVKHLVLHGQRVAGEVLPSEGFARPCELEAWTPQPLSLFQRWSDSSTSRLKRGLRRGQHQRLSSLFVPLDPRTWGHLVVGGVALVVLWNVLQPYWLRFTLKDPPKFVFEVEATPEDSLHELCEPTAPDASQLGFWRGLCSVVGSGAGDTFGGKAVLQLTSIGETGAEFVYGYVQLEAADASNEMHQAGPPAPPSDQLRLWIMEQLPAGCSGSSRREVGLRPHQELALRLPSLLERCQISKEIVLSLLDPEETQAEPILLLHLRRYQIPVLSRLVRDVRTYLERGAVRAPEPLDSPGVQALPPDDWELEFERQRGWTSLSTFPVDASATCPCSPEVAGRADLRPSTWTRPRWIPALDPEGRAAIEEVAAVDSGATRPEDTPPNAATAPSALPGGGTAERSAAQGASTTRERAEEAPEDQKLRVDLVSLTISDCVGFNCAIEFEVWPEGRPAEREKLEPFDAKYQEPHRGLAHPIATSQPATTALLIRALQVKRGKPVAISKPLRFRPEVGQRTPLLFSDEEQRFLFWATLLASDGARPSAAHGADQETANAPEIEP